MRALPNETPRRLVEHGPAAEVRAILRRPAATRGGRMRAAIGMQRRQAAQMGVVRMRVWIRTVRRGPRRVDVAMRRRPVATSGGQPRALIRTAWRGARRAGVAPETRVGRAHALIRAAWRGARRGDGAVGGRA